MMLRRVVLVLTALVAVGATAAPAVAETEVHRDPRGDVRQVDARGARTSADVLRLTGEHEGPSLTVALDLVDLTPGNLGLVEIALRTPGGADYTVQVARGRGGKGVFLERATRRGTVLVDCSRLSGTFLDRRDRVVVIVPRSCVKRPRWVRFGAVAAAATEGLRRAYADDARLDGRLTRSFGPFLGPRRLLHH